MQMWKEETKMRLQVRKKIAGAEGIMRKAGAVAVELQEKRAFLALNQGCFCVPAKYALKCLPKASGSRFWRAMDRVQHVQWRLDARKSIRRVRTAHRAYNALEVGRQPSKEMSYMAQRNAKAIDWPGHRQVSFLLVVSLLDTD